MGDGLVRVIEALAAKVSRKAVIIAIAMVLIYSLGLSSLTSKVDYVRMSIGVITGLALIYTLIQAIMDFINLAKGNSVRGYGKMSKERSKEVESTEDTKIDVD